MKVNKIWYFLLFPVCLLSVAGTVYADSGEEKVMWGSNYAAGNVIPGGSAALEFDQYENSVSAGLYPSMEIILYKPQLGGLAFLDFGLEGGGRFGLPLYKDDLSMGAYGAGTMHFGLKGLDIPGSEIFDRTDFYLRLGLGMDIVDGDDPGLRLCVGSGVNYFLSNRLALGAGYTDWGDYSGFALNLKLRIGKTPEVNGMSGVWKEGAAALKAVEETVYLTQFYTLMAYAFYTGGYFWAPASYSEGEGSVWKYDDGEDNFFVERLLLERDSTGSTWWRMRFYNDTDEIIYEFEMNKALQLKTLLYKDSEGRRERYDYTVDDTNENDLDPATVNDEDAIRQLTASARRENVTVPAGTYKGCYVVVNTNESGEYTWWFAGESDDVAGRLVKYVIDDSEDYITAVLNNVIRGRKGDFLLK